MNTTPPTQPPAQGAAHTPTPWFCSDGIILPESAPADQSWIADCRTQNGKQDANAAFIVEACNTHAAHLARIKVLESGLAAMMQTAAIHGASNAELAIGAAALTPSPEGPV